MQTLNRGIEQLPIPLGQRRGKPDQAVGILDLTWDRAEKESALRGTRAYPSPPMSGSPPRLRKHNQEAAERGQGTYQSRTHDAYRAGPAMSGDEYRTAPPQPPLPPLVARRPLLSDTPERPPYPYRRPEDTIQRQAAYQPPSVQMMPQPQYPLPPVAGPALGPTPYPLPIHPSGPENPPFASPKSQRKTKGHVASACVPCKRAHLRCDAQRPCSRCLSNGKEDSCVDVQHKKRGRPRLRDDREPRFDTGRYAHPPDPTIRRPPSLYTAPGAPPVPFDDPLRRSQSYRVLKSQPRETVGPMFIERGSATDGSNVFPGPSSIPPQAPEPVAFLTIGDLEVVKASSTFIDAAVSSTQSMLPYRSQTIVGRKLVEIVTPPDRDRVLALCKSLQNQQVIKEPNYLPPIYGRNEEERVIKFQPFSPESVSRYQFDRQEVLTFEGVDGQLRRHSIRIGLVKDDSIYFVVLLLALPGRSYPPPSPSPRSQDIAYSYQPQPYTQLTPAPATFDPGRSRLSDQHRELTFAPRQPQTPAQLVPVLSAGMNPNVLSYSASAPARSEHPEGLAHQIPRSELSLIRPTQQADYQLPPIRSHRRTAPPAEATWQRDDRASRVDIGGLIERPGPSPHRRS